MSYNGGRVRKLTPEKHRILVERHLIYVRLRLEAAKHSPCQLAKELNVSESTIRDYINNRTVRGEVPF